SEQIEEAETRLFSLAEAGKNGQGFLTFNTALVSAIDMGHSAFQRQGGLSGIATPPRDLAGKRGGLHPSQLVFPARRPPLGNTAPPTNPASTVARSRARSLADRSDANTADVNPDGDHDGAVVGFFSLEMSAEQLATRILSEQAGIPSEKIRRGLIDERDFKR